jgi:hypothetical protein
MGCSEAGAVLVLALIISGLLAALGISLVMVADTERRSAANAATSAQSLAAADAIVSRALVDLRRAADWTPLVNGTQRSAFADESRRIALASGGTLDLDTRTAELQPRSGAFGADTPRWQLLAWGPLSRLDGTGSIESAQYVSVWIADDPNDQDGDPLTDSDGRVTLHGEARGPGGAMRVVEASVARTGEGVMRVLSWREVR